MHNLSTGNVATELEGTGTNDPVVPMTVDLVANSQVERLVVADSEVLSDGQGVVGIVEDRVYYDVAVGHVIADGKTDHFIGDDGAFEFNQGLRGNGGNRDAGGEGQEGE